jgi:sulfopyruvate decarboxylase TPP-binding subunit
MNHKENLLNFIIKLNSKIPSERSIYFRKITKNEIRYLAEICKNWLAGQIPTENYIVRNLSRLRDDVRVLASKRKTYKIKKLLLKSVRGAQILNTLLPLAIKTLNDIL